MSVITSQPSPFGHLVRERHIELVAKLPMRNQSSLDIQAGEASQEHANEILAIESDFSGVQRSPGPLPGDSYDVMDHTCSTEAWIGQGLLACPSMPLACKAWQREELRPSLKTQSGTHPGLHLLADAHRLHITSKAERHGLVNSSQRRSYVVSSTARERGLLVVTEVCNDCCFHLCGPARSCHLCLQDLEGRVILWFCRPFRLGLSCFPCCQMEMKIFSSNNQLIGTMRQRCRMFSHLLEVCDAQGLGTMKIRGSWATNRCFSEQEFQVLSSTDRMVATIWKKWPGFNEALNMDHETFGVDLVAMDLSSEEVARLLAAAFLLNFMFFEVS